MDQEKRRRMLKLNWTTSEDAKALKDKEQQE
jgi:hypothetical protein